MRTKLIKRYWCDFCNMLLTIVLLSACSTIPPEVADVDELWQYAREHKTCDQADSGDVRYVDNPAEVCERLGVCNAVRDGVPACTVLGPHAYSIMGRNPTAIEIADEAAHRRYCDWHHGFYYYTSRQLSFARELRK